MIPPTTSETIFMEKNPEILISTIFILLVIIFIFLF